MGGKFKYVTLLIWLQLSLIGFVQKHMKKRGDSCLHSDLRTLVLKKDHVDS